jgi:hypothetical protein
VLHSRCYPSLICVHATPTSRPIILLLLYNANVVCLPPCHCNNSLAFLHTSTATGIMRSAGFHASARSASRRSTTPAIDCGQGHQRLQSSMPPSCISNKATFRCVPAGTLSDHYIAASSMSNHLVPTPRHMPCLMLVPKCKPLLARTRQNPCSTLHTHNRGCFMGRPPWIMCPHY